jgi:ribonuclease Z
MMPEYSFPNVTILGSSSATPTSTRNPSAQVVSFSKSSVLLDCAEATQHQFIKYKIKRSRIDVICISHLHADHYLGLMGLLSSYNLFKRTNKLTIIAPPGLEDLLHFQMKLSRMELNYEITFITLKLIPDEVYRTDEFYIEAFPVFHRIYCWGFKLTKINHGRKIKKEISKINPPIEAFQHLKKGKDYKQENGELILAKDWTETIEEVSYCYITDTLYSEDLIQHAQNCTLLYHEATFLNEMKARALETYHSTALEAGMFAQKANVKKLLIGHFSSRYEDVEILENEAKTQFQNTIAVRDGNTYEL